MKSFKTIFLLVFISFSILSCRKEKVTPPTLKYGPKGFGFGADFIAVPGQSFNLHFVADKGNYNLKELEIKRYYDNQTSKNAVVEPFSVPEAALDHFEMEYKLTTRSSSGTEYWTFSVFDKKGNKSSLSVKIIVQ